MEEKAKVASMLVLATILFASPGRSVAQQSSPMAAPRPTSANVAGAPDVAPTFKLRTEAKYPLDALCNHVAGEVVLVVTVDAQGNPVNAEVERTSTNMQLDRAAIDAAHDWKFNPAMHNGIAVPSAVRVPVDFHVHTGPNSPACRNIRPDPHPNTDPNRLGRNEVPDAARLVALELAATHGVAAAQTTLGEIYGHGTGVHQDFAKANAWLEKAAAHGDADAECDLGLLYVNGLGVATDSSKALAWFRKAAEQGNALAESNIGNFYLLGTIVSRDSNEARKWYQKAAAQGDLAGEMYFALLYSNGGPLRDDVLAYAFLDLAMQQDGLEDMKQSTAVALKRRMPPAQIVEAQKLAASWTKGQVLAHHAGK